MTCEAREQTGLAPWRQGFATTRAVKRPTSVEQQATEKARRHYGMDQRQNPSRIGNSKQQKIIFFKKTIAVFHDFPPKYQLQATSVHRTISTLETGPSSHQSSHPQTKASVLRWRKDVFLFGQPLQLRN